MPTLYPSWPYAQICFGNFGALLIIIRNFLVILKNFLKRSYVVSSLRYRYVPWRDNAIQIVWCSTVIHRSRCLACERPHYNILFGPFFFLLWFINILKKWGISLAKQRTLCIICCNMSIASPYYMYARWEDKSFFEGGFWIFFK